MSEVLETTAWVVAHAKHVAIDDEVLERFAAELARERPPLPGWEQRYHFHDGTKRTVFYLLILDTLNFCFWPPPGRPKWRVSYQGEELSGYYALATMLKRAVEEGTLPLEASALARLSLEELKRILNGTGELQLLDRRCEALNELGYVLEERFSGEATALVEAAEGSAVALARLLAREFSSFRDQAEYDGKPVYFYKRAQIFAADLWGAFGGQSWGELEHLEGLTAFADYKLPQALRAVGILRYSPELATRIDHQELLPAGSPEEVEIRAATVQAVERLKAALAAKGWALKSIELDWLLWNLSQEERFKQKPYHRTVTIFY